MAAKFRVRSAALPALAWLLGVSPAAAQPGGEPAPEGDRIVPAPMLLGLRVEAVRTRLMVSPTVVIVGSSDDYAALIARWSLAERFPVLIDDGTERAREDIARFVRAFEPLTVVRWSSAESKEARPKPPTDPAERAEALDLAWRSAWGAGTADELRAVWARTQFSPPGVIVASALDPAWTAALALAAGRGEPILWTSTKPESPSGFLSDEALASLDAAILAGIGAAAGAGEWRGVGDTLDAVTLCVNLGSRIRIGADELALTDRIGRLADGSRYAWCGMIFGDEARSAYAAMCALFLTPGAAWVVDGYKPEFAPPYRLEKATEFLDKAGLRVSTNMPPRGGIDEWRERSRYGIGADFVHVNSSGLAWSFDLNPGRGYASDIPPLNRPAVVHFIHSFSAQFIGDPNTVGGRWIENGAYAYAGSMSEPFLAAFLPGPMVTARLLSKAPWGAAVRQDQGRMWKINVFGDPLITFGPPAPRREAALALAGAKPVEEEMREALKRRRLARGAALLVTLGRDKDAVRLARATLAGNPGGMDPDLARVALWPALREREGELVLALLGEIGPAGIKEAALADLLWRAAVPMLPTADAALIERLRSAVRESSVVSDAMELAPAIARAKGAPEARAFLAELAGRTRDKQAADQLIAASNKY